MSVEAKTILMGAGVGRVARSLTWSVCVLLCAFVALVSYRYLFSVAEAPPVIANNAFKNPWLVVHVAGAATALLGFASSIVGSGALTSSHASLEAQRALSWHWAPRLVQSRRQALQVSP
jgi:hypothetical protein